LRMLFDEVCADTPELRARLAAHDMLLTRAFDPDAAVARIFGALP
ncbi:MAG: glycosyl transferase family 2, partial [Pelagibaca sp.]|nr:glycosyl transferase family 2 [Pelagibaca sp.]